jgi:hypothetical protein
LDWGAFGNIGRAGNDGSNPEREFIHGLSPGFVCGVAVDSSHIYWADYNRETIGRANIDGTGVEPEFIKGAHKACGVAISSTHIYWTSQDGYIGFANLDGSAASVTATPGSEPCGIAVGPSYVYSMAKVAGAYKIYRSGLGSPAVPVDAFTAAAPTGFCGLAIGPPGPNQNLYWTNGGFGSSSSSSGLWFVGTAPTSPPISLAPNTGPEPWGVATDGTYAYWTTFRGEALSRVKVDGTQAPEENLVTGIGNESVGLAVDALPLPVPPVEPTQPGGGTGGGGSGGSGGDGGSGSTAPSTGSPTTTPPPVTTKPKPKPLVCKKGFRRKVVKGKARCAKVKKHKHRRHRHA